MNLFVADPHWGGWIVAYFFLGGIAAGCYFVASLVELAGVAEDRPIARLGYRVAFPLVLACGVLLIIDLDRPERFWHMMLQSEVVNQAFEEKWPWSSAGWALMIQAPMLKVWSPMSIGAWAVFLFGGFSFLSWCTSIRPEGVLSRLLAWRWLRWPWHLAGSGVGFFVASYTGVLLAATNQPLWSQTDWLGPLFLASAASTALATLFLLGHASLGEGSRERLARAETWAILLELTIFAIFLSSLAPSLAVLARSLAGWVLLIGPVLMAMVLPLVLRRGWLGSSRPLGAALAVLAGGLILRGAVVLQPPSLLARPELIAADQQSAPPIGTPPGQLKISPEDNRERGGNVGASVLNRPDPIPARGKVFTEVP